MPYIQSAPRPTNRWRRDRALRDAVRRLLPPKIWPIADDALDTLGHRTSGELLDLGAAAEANPPRHVPYDAWGHRIDRIQIDPSWTALVAAGQQAGLVAAAYDPLYAAHGRVVQAALIQLFEAGTANATCPLSMSDGAARVLMTHDPQLADRWVAALVARDAAVTSGQWMTEQTGGSDVSRLQTRATRDAQGRWRLHGTKWFTSAVTSDIALVLARPEHAEPGSRGLSLFLLQTRTDDGQWNQLRVRRLKDKLGTRALPTAELDLTGAVAIAVGGSGDGVRKVASMLHVTRLWTAHGSVGAVGHLLTLARDYAARREVFGRVLRDQPLHRAWLAELATTYEAMVVLSFRAAELVGRAEHGDAYAATLARVVVPLAKLACTRQGVDTASQLLESFGGAGYLEDSGIPAIFRNVHVQPIWEGTSSVVAHDVLRALRLPGVGAAYLEDMADHLRGCDHDLLTAPVTQIGKAVERIALQMATPAPADGRALAWAMARTYQAVLLCEAAAWALRGSGHRRAVSAARAFAQRQLVRSSLPDEDAAALAFPEDRSV